MAADYTVRYDRNTMDLQTAHMLNDLTSRFYAEAAASFSATREHPWPGWQQVLAVCGSHLRAAAAQGPARVLDLACGNLRFERFLGDALPDAHIEAHAIDDCPQLADACEGALPANIHLAYQQLDIMQALEHDALPATLACDECDLSVAFGFMHHIPLPAWRIETLRALIEHTAPGGFIAVSFWQFLDDERLQQKANAATAHGCALRGIAFDDPHDRLLSWQNRDDIFRYCHHFAEEEIDALVGALPHAREVARFSADGRNGLNRYVILQRGGCNATSTR